MGFEGAIFSISIAIAHAIWTLTIVSLEYLPTNGLNFEFCSCIPIWTVSTAKGIMNIQIIKTMLALAWLNLEICVEVAGNSSTLISQAECLQRTHCQLFPSHTQLHCEGASHVPVSWSRANCGVECCVQVMICRCKGANQQVQPRAASCCSGLSSHHSFILSESDGTNERGHLYWPFHHLRTGDNDGIHS